MASTTKSVAVGLSGGVDSAVAAFLLRERGYSVIGVTMRVWDGLSRPTGSQRSACYGPGEEKNVEDSARVAEALGIPFDIVDLSRPFRDQVLAHCARQYASGLTPNPCVHCNRRLKFGLLFEQLRARGWAVDLFATGHYVQSRWEAETGRHVLSRGRDPGKDQSYFLYRLRQEQLARTIFPLGDAVKDWVRRVARQQGLPVANKVESQDFVAGGYQTILPGPDQPGPILDHTGVVVGRHKGIRHYTVGQRRGLGVAHAVPLYVTGIAATSNTIFVGPEECLYQRSFGVGDVNWVAVDGLKGVHRVEVQIRYRHLARPARIRMLDGDRVWVDFDEPQKAITPGQSAVFYRGADLLGGGVILENEIDADGDGTSRNRR